MWYDALADSFQNPDDESRCVLMFKPERYNIFIDNHTTEIFRGVEYDHRNYKTPLTSNKTPKGCFNIDPAATYSLEVRNKKSEV